MCKQNRNVFLKKIKIINKIEELNYFSQIVKRDLELKAITNRIDKCRLKIFMTFF